MPMSGPVRDESTQIRMDNAPAGPAGDVVRYDVGRLGNVERTPQGGIRVPANLTRTGVFAYPRPDGTIFREYRPPEEVFKADSLATLTDAPVTDLHPDPNVYPEMVTPRNFRQLSRGHAREPRQDGDMVAAHLVIQDQDLLAAVERRDRTEVSCGYRCRMDFTPGTTPQGERYDAVQRDIRYNHVAVVPKGRAGADVALRLDSMGNMVPPGGQGENPQEARVMETIRIDGVDYPLGTPAERTAAIQAMARYQAKLDSAAGQVQAARDTLQGKLDAATAELTTVKAKLAAAEDPARLDAAVQAQVKLRADASRVLGDEAAAKLDGQPAAAVKAAVIAKVFPTVKLDGKSPEYVDAMYEAATVRADADRAADPSGHAPVRAALGGTGVGAGTRQDAAPGTKPTTEPDPADSEAARQRMDADNRGAYKRPLAFSKDKPS